MANIEFRLEAHVAAAWAAIGDLKASPRNTVTIRRLHRHLRLAMDCAHAAQAADVTLPDALQQDLVDLLEAVSIQAFDYVR